MIFGDKFSFAIESEVVSSSSMLFWGKICLWVDNKQVGRYEQTLLGLAAVDLKRTLRFSGRRDLDNLLTRSSGKVLETIHDALYGGDVEELSERQIAELFNKYRSFDVTPHACEEFDGVFIVLLESSNSQKVIWQEYQQTVHEKDLSSGTYEQVVEQFLDWFYIQRGIDPQTNFVWGSSFVFLGNLQKLRLKKISSELSELGGSVVTRLSIETDYVIVGSNGESSQRMLQEAEQLGAFILAEEDFALKLSAITK